MIQVFENICVVCHRWRRTAGTAGWLLVLFAIAVNCPAQEGGDALRNLEGFPDETERSEQLGVRAREIYQAARMVPADVGVFMCFLEAEKTLEILQASDVGDGLAAFYARSNGGRIWREMAEELGLPPQALFEIILGKRLVLVSCAAETELGLEKKKERQNHPEGLGEMSSPVWVALATMGEAEFRQILKLLNAEVIRWVNSRPVYAARQKKGLHVAYRDGTLVLGEKTATKLFDKIIGGEIRESLTEVPGFLDWIEGGAGQISFFAQSAEAVETSNVVQVGHSKREELTAPDWMGWSATITPAGTTIRSIREEAPKGNVLPVLFAAKKYRAGLDLAALERINAGAIWVMVERFGIRPASALGSTTLTAAFVEKHPSVLRYAGPTLFTIVEARDKPVGSNQNVEEHLAEILGSPAQQLRVAWGIELKKPWGRGSRKLDDLLIASLKALKLCIDNPDQLKVPKTVVSEPGRINSVDLTACSKLLVETMPGLERLELHWSVVEDQERAWWVCATDMELFDGVSAALKGSIRLPGTENELAVGVIDGPAVAALLDSWEEVNAGTTHPLFSRLFYLEEMLKAIPRIHWVVTESAEGNRTETTITIDWGF